MSILNYILEELNINEMYRLTEEFLLQESLEDISNLKPLNFDHDNMGHYTFDVEYTENGEPTVVGMNVDIKTDCDSGTMEVSFRESSGGYNSTNRGTTTAEKQKIVKDKMNGVAYCIGYHIENVSCELDKITFAPVIEDKDKKTANNRRANVYLYFAKKYLPKLGIEIKDIDQRKKDLTPEIEDESKKKFIVTHITIETPPFGGEGDIEIEDDEDEFDRRYQEFLEEVSDLLYDLDEAPDDFKEQLKEELLQQFLEYDITDLSETPYPQLVDDINEFFEYLDFIGDDWDNYFHSLDDFVGVVDNYYLKDYVLETIENGNILAIGRLPELKQNNYISSIVDGIDAAIGYDSEIFDEYPNILDKLMVYISKHPKEEDWYNADWTDIDPDNFKEAVQHSTVNDKDKFNFLRAIHLPDSNIPEYLGYDESEMDKFKKDILGLDSEQTKLNI